MHVSPRVAEVLDLQRAWKRVWRDRATDFVAPGLEYRAVARDPTALTERLHLELQSGEYYPSDLRRIDVVKPTDTLRPGAIPVLQDRVLYQALVDNIADTVEHQLLGPPTVFGFQLNTEPEREELFLLRGGFDTFRARMSREHDDGHQFLLETDIAAYFESVDERYLNEALVGLGVDGAVIDTLMQLLNYWNRPVPTGLPQGVWPSDYLGARVYLDRVDKAMGLRGYRYFRYSDDIRIAGDSLVEVRCGLRDIILELRAVGLQVQTAKTRALRPDQVRKVLDRIHERLERTEREKLVELLDIDPYGYTSPEEALRDLSEKEILESEPLLDELLNQAYGDGSNPDLELCRMCLSGYRRIQSRGGIEVALDLLLTLPSLTDEIVRYLNRVIQDEDAEVVRERVFSVLLAPETIHAWQQHWLIRLLAHPKVGRVLTRDDLEALLGFAVDRNLHWSVRSAAILRLAVRGSDAHRRRLRDLYTGESAPDVRHAILRAASRLPPPERTGFYRFCGASDLVTDSVIKYLTVADEVRQRGDPP